MLALQVAALNKSFGGIKVLDGVEMEIEEGERRAIIGPNGAGKTTLFNVINGRTLPSYGKVYLFGKDVSLLPIHKRAQLGLGRTFQRNTLFPNLNVLENIFLALARSRGMHKKLWGTTCQEAIEKIALEMLEEWGLLDRNNEKVRNLSYGEQRELEIILALASGPRLLLLDEPTAGMSPAETAAILRRIMALPRDLTIVLIEHDMNVVFGLADQITVLHYGQVVAQGGLEEIRGNQLVQEIYLGAGEVI